MNEEPEVIVQKSFFQTTKGKLVILALAILVLSAVIFGIKFLPKASKNTVSNITNLVPITLTDNHGFKAEELNLPCPVEPNSCSSQKLVKVNNSSVVTYKLASQSAVLNLVKVLKENIAVSAEKQAGKKYLYTSVPSAKGDKCYIVAYALPLEATIGNILSFPLLEENKAIAAVDPNSDITIQVRSSSLDPKTKCSLTDKSPEFFKSFLST